jgi:hypothetical protein
MRWLFHFAEFSVNKPPLLEARQRCRGFSLQPHIATEEIGALCERMKS